MESTALGTPLRYCPNGAVTATMLTHFMIHSFKYLQMFLSATSPILIFLSFINEMTTSPNKKEKNEKKTKTGS